MQLESKLVPVLREAVTVIQAVLFKRIKLNLPREYPGKDSVYINRLCGAVVNELFGTPNTDPAFTGFNAENHDRIQAELSNVASAADDLLIPLTDALRIQFLCDSLEGIDSGPVASEGGKTRYPIGGPKSAFAQDIHGRGAPGRGGPQSLTAVGRRGRR